MRFLFTVVIKTQVVITKIMKIIINLGVLEDKKIIIKIGLLEEIKEDLL